MKSINFMGDNGFKKALESVGVTASSSISSEKISGCFKYVTAAVTAISKCWSFLLSFVAKRS